MDTKSYYEKIQKIKSIKDIKKSEDKVAVDKFIMDNSLLSFIAIHLFYLLWTVVGSIFAGQWMLFVGLFVFGIFSSFYRKRFYENNARKNINFLRFDSIVSSLIVGFLILNHFHHIA
ncbi:MAG: hypothetical protein AABY15_02020 [Nanoarchaeota archaeon]